MDMVRCGYAYNTRVVIYNKDSPLITIVIGLMGYDESAKKKLSQIERIAQLGTVTRTDEAPTVIRGRLLMAASNIRLRTGRVPFNCFSKINIAVDGGTG